MTSKKRLWEFRFAIGQPFRRQSRVWRAWANHKSDLYLAPGGMGSVHKLSVHASAPFYYFGLTQEEATRQGGIKRKLTKWQRSPVPPLGQRQAAHVVWAAFPTDYLGPDAGKHHGVHWIPAAPSGGAISIDVIITRETTACIEAAFALNGRRLEEYVLLPNGNAVAVVSAIMPDWQNEDLLLRGGPDFSSVAFLAGDPKGYDRDQVILTGPPPQHGEPLRLEELWGNHVPPNWPVPPGTKILTGGSDSVRSVKHGT